MAKQRYGLKGFLVDIREPPNWFTLLRIIGFFTLFIPFYYYSHFFTAFITFLLLAATDWLDGYWARRKNIVTWLGTGLDPVADKILLMGAMFALGIFQTYRLTGLLLLILESALLIIGAMAFFNFHENQTEKTNNKITKPILNSNIFGKTKAVIEIIIISFVFLKKLEILNMPDTLIILIFWIATLAATMSILGHLRLFKQTHLRQYILKLYE